MRLFSSRGPSLASLALTLLFSSFCVASMASQDFQIANDDLARRSSSLKDSILAFKRDGRRDRDGLSNTYKSLDDLYDGLLANIPKAILAPPLLDVSPSDSKHDIQSTYTSFANLMHGLTEMSDAMVIAAPTIQQFEATANIKIGGMMKAIAGVANSWMLLVIAVLPEEGSYKSRAAAQRIAIESHFQAVQTAFSAKLESRYDTLSPRSSITRSLAEVPAYSSAIIPPNQLLGGRTRQPGVSKRELGASTNTHLLKSTTSSPMAKKSNKSTHISAMVSSHLKSSAGNDKTYAATIPITNVEKQASSVSRDSHSLKVKLAEKPKERKMNFMQKPYVAKASVARRSMMMLRKR